MRICWKIFWNICILRLMTRQYKAGLYFLLDLCHFWLFGIFTLNYVYSISIHVDTKLCAIYFLLYIKCSINMHNMCKEDSNIAFCVFKIVIWSNSILLCKIYIKCILHSLFCVLFHRWNWIFTIIFITRLRYNFQSCIFWWNQFKRISCKKIK